MTDKQVKTRLSSNLTALLGAMGLSFYELARRVDVSDQTIANICHGRHEPKVSVLTQICEALGCSPTDLLLPRSDFREFLRNRKFESSAA